MSKAPKRTRGVDSYLCKVLNSLHLGFPYLTLLSLIPERHPSSRVRGLKYVQEPRNQDVKAREALTPAEGQIDPLIVQTEEAGKGLAQGHRSLWDRAGLETGFPPPEGHLFRP
jgi:hypothetical protein